MQPTDPLFQLALAVLATLAGEYAVRRWRAWEAGRNATTTSGGRR